MGELTKEPLIWICRAVPSINVAIGNLTEAQAIALEDMLAEWARLGSWGSSRWTAFFADGDGDFRPKITIDGRKPEFSALIPDRSDVWWQPSKEPPPHKTEPGQGEYRIDFDMLGWRLRAKREAAEGEESA